MRDVPAPFADGQTILFIGDSITDCGRREPSPQFPLGNGYVTLAAARLTLEAPERHLRFINTGVSGDRVTHLAARWDEDVLAHRPDWLSIAIGVNDVWHGADGTDHPTFARVYRELLERTTLALPDCRLILCETTVIGEDPSTEENRLLVPYNETIRELAAGFSALLVPMNGAFHRLRTQRPDLTLTTDGVHPNFLGHQLMADTWLQALGQAD